jgi:two-component system LytT family sensor kinase
MRISKAFQVWFGAATLFGLLMVTYKYLDYVARQNRIPFYFPLIEELTGVYGAALLFLLARWMARRFPVRRATWAANLPRHAVGLLIFSLIHTTSNWISRELLFRLLGLGDYDYGLMSVRYLMEFPIDVILYTLFVWSVYLFDKLAADRAAALRAAQLESRLRQAQLRGLRLQLQPHFLFNALNTISSTMYDEPRAADTMLSRLAELLRVSLRTTQTQEVPLAMEIELLDHYVALLHARFGERLSLQVDLAPGLDRALVPSLILQPLVENAVRHGNLSRLGTGRISVRARRPVAATGVVGSERIRLEVEDDGPGPEAHVDVIAKGIGISSTIERLQLLYGDVQRFETRSLPGTGFQVAFELPLRMAESVQTSLDEKRDTDDTDAEDEVYARAHRR